MCRSDPSDFLLSTSIHDIYYDTEGLRFLLCEYVKCVGLTPPFSREFATDVAGEFASLRIAENSRFTTQFSSTGLVANSPGLFVARF